MRQDLLCAAILIFFVLGCVGWAALCAWLADRAEAYHRVIVKRPGEKPWVFYAEGSDLIGDLERALYCAEAELEAASHE